jgi:cyclopropane-fatty-acyl-phospholipid synthase
MKIQYDLPQAMLNGMLGDGKLIYPKYSMGLWEKERPTLNNRKCR